MREREQLITLEEEKLFALKLRKRGEGSLVITGWQKKIIKTIVNFVLRSVEEV